MGTDKSGVFTPDSTDPNATGIDFGGSSDDPNLPKTDLPTIKITPDTDTVGYFLGEDLVNPVANVQTAAENYADAFNPDGRIYSVNTGNASVKQLEDLKAMSSPPPPIVERDLTFLLPTSILGILLLLL